VCGNLKISKKRVFLSTSHGGWGLFGIRNFLEAQKCGWIRKCKITDQNWKVLLLNSGNGNIARITEQRIDKKINPIVYFMARALKKFVTEFTKRDNNFLEAVILENMALPVSFRDKMPLKIEDIDDEIMRDPGDKKKN
jgi:hypothetical protein